MIFGSFFLVTQNKGRLALVDSCPLDSLVSCLGQRRASMPSWALTASPQQVRLLSARWMGPPLSSDRLG